MSNGLIRGEPVEDDLFLISIEGDFDASMQDQGIAVTEDALKDEPSAILVDVKRCTFLDSTAIAVILGGRQRALAAGIGYALIGHNPVIDRTIELTGLGDELEILADRNEAIAQLTG